jgi:type II secretory pathway pseudopilin PulG
MRAQRGYSLLEVLFAFAVLMLILTISLMAFLERDKRLQQANETILVYQSLANEAEYWRRINYADLAPAAVFKSKTTMLEPLAPYTTTVEVAQTKPGQKSVTLTVRWGVQHEAKLGLVRVDTGGTNLW